MYLVSPSSLRAIAIAAILTGAVGVCAWTLTIADSQANTWRFGGWQRNPYMQVRELGEGFLASTSYVLYVCCWSTLVGGVLLLISQRLGLILLIWQARLSVVINTVFWFFAGVACYAWFCRYGRPVQLPLTLALRAGSILFDVGVWIYLSRADVREMLDRRRTSPARGFSVIVKPAD